MATVYIFSSRDDLVWSAKLAEQFEENECRQRMSYPLCYTNHMMKMKNEEMELVNDNGTWKIKWNDGFERSLNPSLRLPHFVALVNQQIAMER